MRGAVANRGRTLHQKQRFDVAFEKVFGDVAGNAGFAGLQHLEVLVPHFGRYLEAHMQQLAQIRIETRILPVVTQRGSVLFGTPAVDHGGLGQLRVIDIDHGRIGLAQGVAVLISLGVHLLRQIQTLAAGFSQANQLFEPRGARGLEVDSGSGLLQRAPDGGVNRELVTARMHAQLEVGRQAVLADGEGNHRQVFAELLLELNHIAHVIDALVEAPGELGGDGLYRNLLVGDGGQDDQQFRRGLRRIGLVHRNLGDELAAAALLVHVPVDGARLLHGSQILADDVRDGFAVDGEGLGDAGDAHGSLEFRMTLDESLDAVRLGRLADGRGYVQRVEIACLDEAVHGTQVDVIGVHVVRLFPARLPHRLIGGGAHAGGLRAHDAMPAIGFVPDGDYGDAAGRSHHASLQLRLGLVRETVPDTEGEFFQGKHVGIHPNYSSIADVKFRKQYL